jgi:hypothetical protein
MHGGLGLSICQWIAHAHGGTITVQSRVGHGSTLSFPLMTKNSFFIQPAVIPLVLKEEVYGTNRFQSPHA